MKTPEGYEKKELDAFLKQLGCYVVKPATYGYGVSGHSDRIVCYKGQFWAIEVKREGKEPTPIQWKRIREVEAAGGKAFWGVASKIIAEINEFLGR